MWGGLNRTLLAVKTKRGHEARNTGKGKEMDSLLETQKVLAQPMIDFHPVRPELDF